MSGMAQAICVMPFWELQLEDDCINHSGNKVMDVQHNNLVTGKNNLIRFE